ncbi:phosphohexomutase domain-containing protein [Hymenobacter psychrotolerans]|uniref:Phosphomannomutase n=1 Tax=Hymenobacter psychrotolerans DSM 18569 TaxID=1121959 RepID=A0A1M7EPE5_9BACT|nr:hypothetical protein [Hymenobacter psychrotolerans]SHL93577.1 Phosphomannomutase [Hymenobacter psychrotolerans DSM 18569]
MSAETSATTPFVPIAFGTDGWRGLLDVDMTAANVARVATALADHLRTTPGPRTAAVGYDGRHRSAEFARLLAEILSGNGIAVHLVDSIVPTPALAYAVRTQGLQVGVMVTASHNPADYNGLKFKASYGGPFLTEDTHRVELLLDHSPRRQSSVNIQVEDFNAPYLAHLSTLVDMARIRAAQLPVLIDSMHGAGQRLLEQLLRAHGCPADTLAGEARTDFGGRAAEPIEKNLTPLRDALIAAPGRYALGVATDGDADRLGVLLETGEWLSAQETILLLADFVVNGKGLGGDLVKTSSVTDKLLALATPTRRVHDVQVGFKYICEAMLAHDVAFGAEESGGYGLKGHLPERDGLLSALLVLEMLAASGYRTLSALVQAKRAQFGPIHYDRIDLHYPHADRLTRLPDLHAAGPATVAGFAVAHTAAFYSSRGVVNGLKFRLAGDTRWLLLRASETEPLMRLYAEGQSAAEVAALLAAGQELLQSA